MKQKQWSQLAPQTRALVATTAVFVLLLPVWWGGSRWYDGLLVSEQRAVVLEAASLHGNNVSAAVNRRLARLQGLYAFVQTELDNPNFTARFETFAAGLYAGSTAVRSFAVAPDGVVRYIYPLEGNRAVLGYEITNDARPEIVADAERAYATGDVVLTGPVALVQGGRGLIARQAIYRGDEPWGLVNMVLDLDRLLAEVGVVETADSLHLALQNEDGQVFYGDPAILNQSPVMVPISLPGGDWKLIAAPETGWAATVQRPLRVFQGAGLVIMLLFAGLTYSMVNRQARLETAVRHRTRELMEIQQTLEQRVAERTRDLSMMLDVSAHINAELELSPLLDRILEELHQVVDYAVAAVLRVDEDQLVLLAYQGAGLSGQARSLSFPIDRLGRIWEKIDQGQFVIIDNVWGDAPLAQAYRRAVADTTDGATSDSILRQTAHLCAWMAVPLRFQERTIGMLAFQHEQCGHFTVETARLTMGIANHAAIAMANAHLFAQGQQLVLLQERQRLARELHDSVSQALYGIALGAKTARTLLDRQPERATEPLDYVLSLAEAALMEMRALIFELRPESLEREGIVAALTRQTAVLSRRHQIETMTDFCAEPDIPLAAKEALYRVAQEALHNVVKHAQAQHVAVSLDHRNGSVQLLIRDDGQGFNPEQSFPGHLGLQSMAERMARVGGTFSIQSRRGEGTGVAATAPLTTSAADDDATP